MLTRSSRFALLSLAVLGLLLPAALVTGQEESVERFKVKLLGIETYYGSEKWKTLPSFHSQPANAARNQTGEYDRAVGQRIALRIQLTDEAGNNVPADPLENRNVNITAYMRTGRGNVPAYILRNPGTIPGSSDSLVFRLFFDVDGTTPIPGGPNGVNVRDPLPGLTTAAYVHINIFKQGSTGTRIDAGQDDLVFNYVRPSSTVTIDTFGERDYIAQVPDGTFRLMNDIGEGDTVPFVTEQVPGASTVRAEYAFGVPDRTVRWLALTPVPCASLDCFPTNGVTRTEILSREVASAKTNEFGNVSFSAAAKDLLAFGGRSLSSGLVVMAAVLVPEIDLPPELGAQYAKGGFDIVAGADEFVLPIASRPARVTGYDIDTTAMNSGAPSQVSAINYLTVKLYDDMGQPCLNCGDAVAIQPDGVGNVLSRGQISSVADPALASKYREARLPVSGIHAAKVSWYRVLALLYGSPGNGDSDVFQGMAYADRGFIVETASTPSRITEPGTYYFNITSRSTNYDLRTGEPDFRMRLVYRVASENGFSKNETITLDEGAVRAQQLKISSSRIGGLSVTYQVTSGDTVFGPNTDTMQFHDRAPRKRLADRIPGFEVALLAGALLAAVLVLRRREAF